MENSLAVPSGFHSQPLQHEDVFAAPATLISEAALSAFTHLNHKVFTKNISQRFFFFFLHGFLTSSKVGLLLLLADDISLGQINKRLMGFFFSPFYDQKPVLSFNGLV